MTRSLLLPIPPDRGTGIEPAQRQGGQAQERQSGRPATAAVDHHEAAADDDRLDGAGTARSNSSKYPFPLEVQAGIYDFANDDSDPMDDHNHGTHVAGIISGCFGPNGCIADTDPCAFAGQCCSLFCDAGICSSAGQCGVSAPVADADSF